MVRITKASELNNVVEIRGELPGKLIVKKSAAIAQKSETNPNAYVLIVGKEKRVIALNGKMKLANPALLI